MNPIFSVIDGIDGAGKGTLIENLKNNWKWGGLDLFFDPGISHDEQHKKWQNIRNFIKQEEMDPLAETCMFFSMRAQLMSEIEKSLKSNRSCLCDRFSPSTWVYQGYCKKQLKFIEDFESIFHFREPDVLFLLMAPFDLLTERLIKRNANIDKFKSNEGFRRKVYDGYLKYIDKHVSLNKNLHIINTDKTPEEVLKECTNIIEKHHG